jgi:prolyl-tRNA synthetase
MEANQTKIQNIVKAKELKFSTDDEINSINAVAGCASPIGINRDKTIVIVDDYIANTNNLIIGANEEHYHFENSCYGRDYEADIISDIVEAFDGARCPISESPINLLKSVRGIEVGNIFQLGTKYTEALGAYYIDEKGNKQTIIMGSYGIGLGRLLACLAEEYNDKKGLQFPITVAPYQVIITPLIDSENIKSKAESLYELLLENNIEVILDDRDKKDASLGEKLNDADLIGVPIRILISNRSLTKGGVEVKLRRKDNNEIVPLNEIVEFIKNLISEEIANIKNRNVNSLK